MPDGNGHKQSLTFTRPPERVVSLVPSMTESLFDLGLGASVVGVTDFCIYPAAGVAGLPRLGGPKTPDVEKILALQPDLILANQEENTPQSVEALEAAGLRVWVTFPQTVRQSLNVLWTLVGIYHSHQAAPRVQSLEVALDWVESAMFDQPTWRYFCPIWQHGWQTNLDESDERPWWMTFNQQTYMHDLLRLFGGQNVFAERQRQYPLDADLGLVQSQDPAERDTRYPRVTHSEIIRANPEVIILPSEPYTYKEADVEVLRRAFAETDAVKQNRIHLIDGSLLTWHGTRLGRALQELPAVFA